MPCSPRLALDRTEDDNIQSTIYNIQLTLPRIFPPRCTLNVPSHPSLRNTLTEPANETGDDHRHKTGIAHGTRKRPPKHCMCMCMATVQPQRANGSPHPSHTHTDPGPQHPIGPAPGPLRRPALKTRCNRSNIGLLSAQIPAARRRSSALLQPSSAPRKTAPASPHATRSETFNLPDQGKRPCKIGKSLGDLGIGGEI